MAEIIQILKPQEPLKRGDKYIFPLTSTDQIIVSGQNGLDGDRLTLADVVKQDTTEAEAGEAPLVSADTLGGEITAEDVKQIGQVVSNPNLLYNPFFTVAQAGYGGNHGSVKYAADRWINSGNTAQNANGGINISLGAASGVFFAQRLLESECPLFGKTVTFSANIGGTIYKYTTTLPSSDNVVRHQLYGGFTLVIGLRASSTHYIGFEASSTSEVMNLRSVKLEYGTISTLANDSAPDYATELAKCRHYFRRYTKTGGSFMLCLGVILNTTQVHGGLTLDVPMRIAPTLSYSSLDDLEINTSGGIKTATAAALNGPSPWAGDLRFTVSGVTAGQDATVFLKDGGWVDLSADL